MRLCFLEPPVRVALAFVAALACLAPAAQAGVHMHLPKNHHRHRDHADTAGAPAPVSDVPDAIWTNGRQPH